jgi:tetratricopeptide (TPR) repeat protein
MEGMKHCFGRGLGVFVLLSLAGPPVWATCGGGGGGGTGGMGGSGQMLEEVYQVPWKVPAAGAAVPSEGLVLYWFPSSADEVRRSSLRVSRTLSLYASQCVALQLAGAASAAGRQFDVGRRLPVVVLATAAGELLGRVDNSAGMLKVGDVERLLQVELKRRESALEQQLNEARGKARAGDGAAAAELLRGVAGERCLFPKKAKDAARELEKLGQHVDEKAGELDAPAPVFEAKASARIADVMRRGLRAERAARYQAAARRYDEAARLDPADPTPLRYLGELHRHHTGEWDKARPLFARILAMRADPLSRAVAQHGLGKITIHEGDFARGLALFEASLASFPLALTYRNLAVYWNSEGDAARTAQYVDAALKLDPSDPYNRVFAAVFMAQAGREDEALAVARENEGLLPASYNLAAIHAQAGERDAALALLKRHFYEYERYQAVRAKEMMEARVDAVFLSIRKDPAFVSLTAEADGMLPVPMN